MNRPTAADRQRPITYPREAVFECRENPSRMYYPVQHSDDVTITERMPHGTKRDKKWFVVVTLPTPDSWVLMRNATPGESGYHMCFKLYGDKRHEIVCTYKERTLLHGQGLRGCEEKYFI